MRGELSSLSFGVTPAIREALFDLSVSQRRSISFVVREIVKNHLTEKGHLEEQKKAEEAQATA